MAEIGISEGGISFQEVKAWAEITNTPRSIFVSTTIVKMARAYINMSRAATDSKCRMPGEKGKELEAKQSVKAFDSLFTA